MPKKINKNLTGEHMVVCERGEVVAVGVSLPTTTTSCVCVCACVSYGEACISVVVVKCYLRALD